MLERALDAGVPAQWVTADAVYGGDRRLRLWLEERQMPHVLAVKRTEPLWTRTTWRQVAAQTLAAAVPAEEGQRVSAGGGAQSPRLYEGARGANCALPDPGWGYLLLGRRRIPRPTGPGDYA